MCRAEGVHVCACPSARIILHGEGKESGRCKAVGCFKQILLKPAHLWLGLNRGACCSGERARRWHGRVKIAPRV